MNNDAIHTPIQDTPLRPEWIRLPKSGQRCPITGLSRSKLNELILPCAANGWKPLVLSKSLKTSKWAKRGVRLVCVRSLLDLLEAQ
jgi:hypothetical protein